ncbi:MAG TPA: hypothetical protein VII82_04650 [Polyangiaceae bacterium]
MFRRATLPFARAALATMFVASLATVASVTGAALLGCGGDPAKAPTILRPLDEPHAVAVMARVFRQLGVEPVRNRVIQFGSSGNSLTLDVAAKNRRFGIAYITWQDADKLGDDLPKRGDPDAIVVVHGSGADDDVHTALLFAADYMQDDLSGERHTSTAIAAEQKLELATRDVLHRAEQETWP